MPLENPLLAQKFMFDGQRAISNFDGDYNLACKVSVVLVVKMLQYVNDTTTIERVADIILTW